MSKINLLISKVATLVVSHVAFGPETLSTALWALEGPLVNMDPHVNAKILLFTEGFSTSWEGALVGLSPIVQV